MLGGKLARGADTLKHVKGVLVEVGIQSALEWNSSVSRKIWPSVMDLKDIAVKDIRARRPGYP